MASIDCILNSSSNSAKLSNTHLIRHSSLPNLFLCQPELTTGALGRLSSFNNCSLLSESPSFLTASKVALCRALSSSHSCDHGGFPELEIPAYADVHSGFFRPSCNGLNECTAFLINKKEASVAESLDMEKSIVYSDLRESVCRWEVPPRFFKPYDMGEKAFAERDTPTHTLHKPRKPAEEKSQTLSELCREKNSQNDVKGRPMSLRMLKRKRLKVSPPTSPETPASPEKQRKPKERVEKSCASELASFCDTAKPRLNVMGVSDAVSSAFTSLVFMLKMLHQHALSPARMRTHASGSDAAADEKLYNWACRAYAEMLDSFLWLFQQVFSCTPKLMLLTMMLLADFTLHSVTKHVAVPLMPLGEPPTAATASYNSGKPSVMGGIAALSRSLDDQQQRRVCLKEEVTEEECFGAISLDEQRGGGGSGVGAIKHGESYSEGDGDSSPLREMTLEHRVSSVDGDDVTAGIPLSLSSLLGSSLLSHHVGEINQGTDLDVTTKNMLVAPVRAPALEADDYPCFDRTDLAYQQEISMDPSNPLLLANYAQFLHVVRHDNSRAEKLYRRAVMVDMDVDGEVMARFASFLWVVKGDVAEADRVYKAAVEADPTNTYHAGCYAHFLWNSSACQAEETSSCCVVNNLGTIS